MLQSLGRCSLRSLHKLHGAGQSAEDRPGHWRRVCGNGLIYEKREGSDLGYFDSVYESNLNHRARAVLFYLKDHADSEGKCWPGIRTIAVELGLSRSTVKRALDDLVRAEFVEKSGRLRGNGGFTSNLYRIDQRPGNRDN